MLYEWSVMLSLYHCLLRNSTRKWNADFDTGAEVMHTYCFISQPSVHKAWMLIVPPLPDEIDR
jgi:hypothetical protein